MSAVVSPPAGTGQHVRRFDLEAALLDWTPEDGRLARALDTGQLWRYFAEVGWVLQVSHDDVVVLVEESVAATVAVPVQWYVAAGGPAPGDGNDLDLALDPTNGDLYEKQAGVWTVIGNITGPTGVTGAAGVANYPFVIAMMADPSIVSLVAKK